MIGFLKTFVILALFCGSLVGISYETVMAVKNTETSFLWVGSPYLVWYVCFLVRQCREALHG